MYQFYVLFYFGFPESPLTMFRLLRIHVHVQCMLAIHEVSIMPMWHEFMSIQLPYYCITNFCMLFICANFVCSDCCEVLGTSLINNRIGNNENGCKNQDKFEQA